MIFDFIVELDCSTLPASPARMPPALFKLKPVMAFILGVLITAFLSVTFSAPFFYEVSELELAFFSVDRFIKLPIFFDLADRKLEGFILLFAWS